MIMPQRIPADPTRDERIAALVCERLRTANAVHGPLPSELLYVEELARELGGRVAHVEDDQRLCWRGWWIWAAPFWVRGTMRDVSKVLHATRERWLIRAERLRVVDPAQACELMKRARHLARRNPGLPSSAVLRCRGYLRASVDLLRPPPRLRLVRAEVA